MEEILQITDVTKTFTLSRKQRKLEKTSEKKKIAVKHLSLSAYRGEIFGLLGPNGAGKTTTLRMIATLIKPDQGEILVEGRSSVTEPFEVRNRIGFLTSELKLEDYFTPNYLYDFFSRLHGVEPEISAKRKQDLFGRFGIDEFAEVKVADLSTGMKQKVSLVISIAHDPEVIIFDEPTNGLDVLTARVVTDFLMELKHQGKSIILSTHIFELVEKLCDRVGIIINGELTDCDTLEAVKQGMTLEDRFFQIYQEKAGDLYEK